MESGIAERFKSLDPEFPFIATAAAAEVDQLLKGKSTTLQNTKQVAEFLRQSSFHGGDSGATRKSSLDPVGTQIVYDAFEASHPPGPPPSHQDLVGHSLKLLDKLNHPSPPPEVLAKIKDFCLALANYALANYSRPYDIHDDIPQQRI